MDFLYDALEKFLLVVLITLTIVLCGAVAAIAAFIAYALWASI